MVNINKKTTFAIAIILMLTIVPMSSFTRVKADLTTSYAYIAVSPSTTQVNIPVLIEGWTSPTPLGVPMGAGTQVMYRFNHTVTLTKPDGTTYVKTAIDAYGDGTFFFMYTPDQVGNWTAVVYWPGDSNFAASTSTKTKFSVQSDPIPKYPDAPLPTQYWTRPINAQNRDWAQYLADWNVNGYPENTQNYQPWGHAPESPHILWTYTTSVGGIMGGIDGDASYRFGITPTAVIGGRAYMNCKDGYYCLDIYTGKVIWGPKTFTGTLFFITNKADPDPGGAATHYEIWDYHSVGWIEVFDASTGAYSSNKTGTAWVGAGITKLHEGYFYFLNGRQWIKWDPFNISPAAVALGKSVMNAPFADKILWNVTIPTGVATPSVYSGNYAAGAGCQSGFDLTTGDKLWNTTGARPEATYWRNVADQGQGLWFQSTMRSTFEAYDLATGKLKWESSPAAPDPWGTFWSYYICNAYGYLYGMGYTGQVYAYDIKNGHLNWTFSADKPIGDESPFDGYPFWQPPVVVDGKVYAGTTEHTPTQPRVRGNELYCIDAYTGDLLWKVNGAYTTKVIADSKLITANEYDSLTYCFDKGPTAATVSASPSVLSSGSSVLVTGTILDQSPGQINTACVSEDSMTGMMNYLHMQMELPSNTTGVPINLSAVAPDGTVTTIATVTSDVAGNFAYLWTPAASGTYTVVANFAGSTSYWPAFAETAVGVTAAPSATPTSQAEAAAPDNTMVLYGILVVVILALVISIYAVFKKR